MGSTQHRDPWNKGKLVGQKPPRKPKDIWAVPTDGRAAAIPSDRFLAGCSIRACGQEWIWCVSSPD